VKRLHAAAVVLALLVGSSPASRAEDAVPSYELPADLALPALDASTDAAAGAALATILDPASGEDAEDAVRVLAGIGRGALPRVAAGLKGANWPARAALVAAVAEMDAPEVTPLLVAAGRDPSFAVREAAVVGLGKTGDARGAATLVRLSSDMTEPVWRVRAASAAALRRAALRGVLERPAGEAALARLLLDADEDVGRAALREIAPLAAASALPAILEVFSDPTTDSHDRTLALTALRAYRSPTPELLAALRRGLLSGEDSSQACEAGRALMAMRGVEALDDEEVSRAVLHRMREADHEALRDGLARLGKPVAPWLRARALDVAARIAAGREIYPDTPLEELLDTLIQVDEAAGLAFVKELLAGKDAETFDRETRLAALRKVEIVFAARMRTELRALFDAGVSNLSADILRAIVASGGDDLASRLDAALAIPEKGLRKTALELLDRRPDLPAGPRLLALAADAAEPEIRRAALETLSRRDPEKAAAIAASLLDDPRADMRSKAISLLSASREQRDFERLVARLAVEDGGDIRPAKPSAVEPAPPPAGVTPSERESSAARNRRRIVRELVLAVAMTGGDAARPVLLRVAETDPDAAVREAAVRGLRDKATAEDAPRLLAIEAKEADPMTRRESRRALAALAGSPDAVRFFEKLVADANSRPEALRLLAEPQSTVIADALLAGLKDREWTDDERRDALVALKRAGRAPDAAGLAALVLDARTLELLHEAARALADVKSPEATRELLSLLGKFEDPERLSAVVQTLGGLGAPEAEAPLLAQFAKARERAFAAASAADPAVDLYRRCADAVAAFGSQATGEAIAEHLLDPRLAHSAGRRSVMARGPFQPPAAAPVAIVRWLVAAFARRDDAACGRLLAARLDALAADARDLRMPEGYVAGVARYLEAPLAYGLPGRPRPSAALLLWRLVLRTAPRMSELDSMAWLGLDEHLGERRRWRDAGDALRAYRALADVEDAARSREERFVEDARIAVRDALAAAADGREDEALSIARRLRDADPTNGELAYREAYCLVRLGRADAEARSHLIFAAAQDDKDARIHFYLGWTAESTGDARAALASYSTAVSLDQKRVQQRSAEELFGYRGAAYDTAAYSYWLSRALRAAGRDKAAFDHLAAAVSLDDRHAEQARTDAAFRGWDRLDAAVAAGLAKIGGGALR
jgi:HEAT repeat protein